MEDRYVTERPSQLLNHRLKIVPKPGREVGLLALKRMLKTRSPMDALAVFHQELGDVFQITFPGFNPVMLVGAEAARFLLVEARDDMRWRMDGEPIALLLRHGVLMEDGDSHDALRQVMNPALHRRMLTQYVEAMVKRTDEITSQWQSGNNYDMLVEARKIALLILTDSLFNVDFSPEMARLWDGVLRAVRYISPGLWVMWRGFAPLGYSRKLREIDAYLFQIIAERRKFPGGDDDLLGALVHNPALTDDLIRDQLMTMLIAGHDTSTANLAWTLYLLGKHPDAMQRAKEEVQGVIGDNPPQFEHLRDLTYLGAVIDESLRLYPPIHLGSRFAARDLEFNGYHIPAGMRVLYSIYLTHRHPAYWSEPDTFKPERFLDTHRQEPYTFIPFGGGPRNCIGGAFAQVEAKVVLARILQRYDLRLLQNNVRVHMGATLEPRPGVRMQIKRNRGN